MDKMNDCKILNSTSALEYVGQDDLSALRDICKLAKQQQANLEEVDCYGNTALLKACSLGRFKAVKILLKFGANIKAINYLAQNALTIATFQGDIRIVRKLLEYRSYADFNESSTIPALNVAIMRKNRRLVKYLRSLNEKPGQEGNREHLTTAHGLTPEDFERFINLSDSGQTHTKIKKIII